ncbi:MAG: 30S ribosomal protein S8e [Thermoplasmatales archaeon]|jgi:small subunit ribosomal protein S8e|nr:30S ribosomal protein S8e [Thermoplasmatales archaeon]
MAIWQGKSKRKPTGGRIAHSAGKKKFEIGREKQFTRIGTQSIRLYRTRGGHHKGGILQTEYANVVDTKTGITKKVKILNVKVNPADPNYVQRSIVNKGATVETEIGLAKVTSRPGQDGTVNAVLTQ